MPIAAYTDLITCDSCSESIPYNARFCSFCGFEKNSDIARDKLILRKGIKALFSRQGLGWCAFYLSILGLYLTVCYFISDELFMGMLKVLTAIGMNTALLLGLGMCLGDWEKRGILSKALSFALFAIFLVVPCFFGIQWCTHGKGAIQLSSDY